MHSLNGRRLALGMLLNLLLAASALADDGRAPAPKKHHVVFQVTESDPRKWELTLSNVSNIQKDIGKDNIDVEIVAYGPGIDMFKLESTSASRVAEAQRQGVHVLICENTMRGQKLSRADMLDNLDYVEAGVSALIKRQEQGWSYIRP